MKSSRVSSPEKPAVGAPLVAFLIAAIIGEVATIALLWPSGPLITVVCAPFGGVLFGGCALGIASPALPDFKVKRRTSEA